jgi:outer membrane protein TolC
MHKKHLVFLLLLSLLGYTTNRVSAQVLTLRGALQTALANYGVLKAKTNYVNASKASVKQSQRNALPDFNLSAQQDYGTINGQSGASYGYRGLSVASSGPVLASQNWNAAFGALYLANINWDFYSFGKVREQIKVSQSILTRDERDLEQEYFEHQVRVSSAYLNLLAAQQLTRSQQKNLDRAVALTAVVVARVKNGLNAGVDSSLANAEVSNAKIALTSSIDYEEELDNQLAILLGTASQRYILDTTFIVKIPSSFSDTGKIIQQEHPLLKYYQSRIDISNEEVKYYHTFNYPTFSAFGILQDRGSGFNYDYGTLNQDSYSGKYWDGVNPSRSNYLLGIGLIWNLTTPLRIHQQEVSQKFTSRALEDEKELVNQQLKNELLLSQTKMDNAMANYKEAPIQVKAATDAYLQKSILYKNGLSNIVDVTQALYALNRAETDRDIAFTNVWQALLLKASASGNFSVFINEF